jgi:hypothetical protein
VCAINFESSLLLVALSALNLLTLTHLILMIAIGSCVLCEGTRDRFWLSFSVSSKSEEAKIGVSLIKINGSSNFYRLINFIVFAPGLSVNTVNFRLKFKPPLKFLCPFW